jgi:hypothetical protein
MKQTARNNEFLKTVKNSTNTKIYKKVLNIYNEKGVDESIQYLNQFFNWEKIESIKK